MHGLQTKKKNTLYIVIQLHTMERLTIAGLIRLYTASVHHPAFNDIIKKKEEEMLVQILIKNEIWKENKYQMSQITSTNFIKKKSLDI